MTLRLFHLANAELSMQVTQTPNNFHLALLRLAKRSFNLGICCYGFLKTQPNLRLNSSKLAMA